MLYTEYKPGQDADDFYMSRYGYIVEPDGTILSLQELQVHGQIAYERNAIVSEYYDALEEDRKSSTKMAAEIYATEKLGHIRISIAPYIGQWSVGTSWSVKPTREQKKATKFLFEVCGVDDEEIWGNFGPIEARDFLRSM